MTRPLVWLPFDPSELGDPPSVLRYEVVDPAERVPDSVDEVEVYVPPYRVDSSVATVLPRMTRLRYVLALTAGVENLRDLVPEGAVLCTGRGIHDDSTAELALTLILASLRGVPDFVRAQDRGAWEPAWRPALADKRVLLVGYGAVGAAIEARLLPFRCEVVRVASRAREGVDGVEDLPRLLPEADVVVLSVPLTDATRGMADAAFLGRMRSGALLVNVARGGVVVTGDLVEALTDGRVTAALDVTDPEPLPADHPLWMAPGLLVTPHVGGPSSAMWPRAYRLVRDQLHRIAAGQEPVNRTTSGY